MQYPQYIDWNIARKIGLLPASSSASMSLEEWFQTVQGSGGAAQVGFLQSGTGATARTAQAKMRERYSPQDTGATADGIANDGADIGQAITNIGTGVLKFPGNLTYLTSALTSLIYSKLSGYGATLKPSADSMTVLSMLGGQTLQSGDQQYAEGFVIDGSGRTTITGVAVSPPAGQACSNLILRDIVVANCDTFSFNLAYAQFMRCSNLRAIKTSGSPAGCGYLVHNDASLGEGNSNELWAITAEGQNVGVLINGTNFATGCVNNVFQIPEITLNDVCGMAFFDAKATVYGGSLELNASGASTIVVDGKTVKKSSVYLNNSSVLFDGIQSGEASADPCYLIENGSTLQLKDAHGYGVAGGRLVQTDGTSTVQLQGTYASIGVVQDVGSWPDAFIVQSLNSILYGAPVTSVDESVTALYSAQAPSISGGGASAPTISNVEDSDLGYCTQVIYQAVTAGTSIGICSVGAGTASMDSIYSVLVKSSIDCALTLQFKNGTGFNDINTAYVNLKAGVVTRIVGAKNSIPANGTWQVWFENGDAGGPTIKFSRMMFYQGTANTAGNTEAITKIVKYGAFNPGPTRDTATNIQSKTAAVNTNNKYPGKEVWDTTNNRVLYAGGATSTSVWKDGAGTTIYTPA